MTKAYREEATAGPDLVNKLVSTATLRIITFDLFETARLEGVP